MTARDVFICHASTSKETHARPLVDALDLRGVSAWLDEGVIRPGESIIDAINDGLKLARYVVPIVTDDFFSRRWARKELNAALSREVRLERMIIIPVLDVEQSRWFEAFPILEDKLYLSWDFGVAKIASRIAELFAREPAVEWVLAHPQEYVGGVWLRCTPERAVPHTLTLRWGPLIRTVEYCTDEVRPWSMVHHKSAPDAVPFHVSVEPAAIITAGQGPAPDVWPRAFNIDEGWVRAAGAPVAIESPPDGIRFPSERSLLAERLDCARGLGDEVSSTD